jgi:hypothetical protein
MFPINILKSFSVVLISVFIEEYIMDFEKI